MSKPKDDATTDIAGKVNSFISDMNSEMASWAKARAAEIEKFKALKAKDPKRNDSALKLIPVISFKLDPSPDTTARTPAEQAEQVAAGRSQVCWSAHMSDRARHVLMKINAKVEFEPAKSLGKDDFDAFKKVWTKVMKNNALKNHKGSDGWGDGDGFHLELEASKIKKADERAIACIEEYVRLTRDSGKKNDKFEKTYAKEIMPLDIKLNKSRNIDKRHIGP